jgi:hypothetical protein
MSLSQTGTKGGEPCGNTDQKPAEQESSEAVHQRERETCHSSGIDLLHPFGTENQEHNPQGHREKRLTQYELLGNGNSNEVR